jgi:hypothetical protein
MRKWITCGVLLVAACFGIALTAYGRPTSVLRDQPESRNISFRLVQSDGALGGIQVAQAKTNGKGGTSNKAAKDTKKKERVYLTVSAQELESFPQKFLNADVQMADIFKKYVGRAPKSLSKYKISRKNHVLFTTHPATGSHMLCVVRRDNKAAISVLDTLVNESPLYLRGRVGKVIDAVDGIRPIFMVEELYRGHKPPIKIAVVKRKDVHLIVEYAVRNADGTPGRRRAGRWRIPVSKKTYVIPNPYNRSQSLFIAIEF